MLIKILLFKKAKHRGEKFQENIEEISLSCRTSKLIFSSEKKEKKEIYVNVIRNDMLELKSK